MRRSSRLKRPNLPKSAMWGGMWIASFATWPILPLNRRARPKCAKCAAKPKSWPKTAFSTFCCRPPKKPDQATDAQPEGESATRQKFRKRLREGKLNDKAIDLELEAPAASMNIVGPPGMEEMTEQIRSMFSNLSSGRKVQRKIRIQQAMKLLIEEEASKMLNPEEIKAAAVQNS